jgi:Domain of unknown function (DUF4249)
MASIFNKSQGLRCTLFVLFTMLLFASCEQEKLLENDIPYRGDKIVLQGFISQQEGVMALVQKTLPPSQPDGDATLPDAEVTLFEDGIDIGKLVRSSDGIFRTNPTFIVNPIAKYHLMVTSIGLTPALTPDVTAEPLVKFDSTSMIWDSTISNFAIIYYKIKDGFPNKKNAYTFTLEYYGQNGRLSPNWENNDIFDAFGLISDVELGVTGKSDLLRLNSMYQTGTGEVPIYNYKIKLHSFSTEVSNFLESIYKDEGVRQLPWYEPLPVYSNIIGGYGIWGAYSVDIVEFRIR